MKKTDTCYYMSITKEENSAFVVANNQSGVIGEGTQVIVETKTDVTSASNISTANITTTNTTTATMNSMGATSATTTTTTTTTISTSCTVGGGGDGNGTAISNGADAHQRFSNSCNVALSETLRRQETCTGPRVQDRSNGHQSHRAPLPPQVILQVLPSTPTPIQHHNLLASDVHRECRMRLAASYLLSSTSCFSLFFSFSLSLFFLLTPYRLALCDKRDSCLFYCGSRHQLVNARKIAPVHGEDFIWIFVNISLRIEPMGCQVIWF